MRAGGGSHSPHSSSLTGAVRTGAVGVLLLEQRSPGWGETSDEAAGRPPRTSQPASVSLLSDHRGTPGDTVPVLPSTLHLLLHLRSRPSGIIYVLLTGGRQDEAQGSTFDLLLSATSKSHVHVPPVAGTACSTLTRTLTTCSCESAFLELKP